MKFLNWGRAKRLQEVSFRATEKRADDSTLHRGRLETSARDDSLLSGWFNWFLGGFFPGEKDSDPPYRVRNPGTPGAIKNVSSSPLQSLPRLIKTDRGWLMPKGVNCGDTIAYPLRGRHRGLGTGTVLSIGQRAKIGVKRPDGYFFTVHHRLAP